MRSTRAEISSTPLGSRPGNSDPFGGSASRAPRQSESEAPPKAADVSEATGAASSLGCADAAAMRSAAPSSRPRSTSAIPTTSAMTAKTPASERPIQVPTIADGFLPAPHRAVSATSRGPTTSGISLIWFRVKWTTIQPAIASS